jgi:adenylate cyclase class 2
MREIEIKARVQDSAALLKKLAHKQIELSEPVTQRDRVFGLLGEDGGGQNKRPWLRIRTEMKGSETKQIFTFKRSVTNQLDSIEYETEVSSEAELENIILELGFEPYSDTTKTRRKERVDDIELCYDDVQDLGVFIEAEKLVEDKADFEVITAQLWRLLGSLDVVRDDQVYDGYDVLGRKQNGLM